MGHLTVVQGCAVTGDDGQSADNATGGGSLQRHRSTGKTGVVRGQWSPSCVRTGLQQAKVTVDTARPRVELADRQHHKVRGGATLNELCERVQRDLRPAQRALDRSVVAALGRVGQRLLDEPC